MLTYLKGSAGFILLLGTILRSTTLRGRSGCRLLDGGGLLDGGLLRGRSSFLRRCCSLLDVFQEIINIGHKKLYCCLL